MLYLIFVITVALTSTGEKGNERRAAIFSFDFIIAFIQRGIAVCVRRASMRHQRPRYLFHLRQCRVIPCALLDIVRHRCVHIALAHSRS